MKVFAELSIPELVRIAYALECRFGYGDEMANQIYDFLKELTGNDYRL
jgi:hypothetical protein